MSSSPFETLESAHEYVRLLLEQIEEGRTGIAGDLRQAEQDGAARRLEALQLVDYKLLQLRDYMAGSSRILNDLRALRRLLIGE
jgi:hypothetical protein